MYTSELDNYLSHSDEPEWVTEAGHMCCRHWPGEGSVAMAWVIRREARGGFRSIEWEGRAGRITWGRRDPQAPDRAATLQSIVGAHCAFGEMAQEGHANIAVFGYMSVNMLADVAAHAVSQVSARAPVQARAGDREEAREAMRTRPNHRAANSIARHNAPGRGGSESPCAQHKRSSTLTSMAKSCRRRLESSRIQSCASSVGPSLLKFRPGPEAPSLGPESLSRWVVSR